MLHDGTSLPTLLLVKAFESLAAAMQQERNLGSRLLQVHVSWFTCVCCLGAFEVASATPAHCTFMHMHTNSRASPTFSKGISHVGHVYALRHTRLFVLHLHWQNFRDFLGKRPLASQRYNNELD